MVDLNDYDKYMTIDDNGQIIQITKQQCIEIQQREACYAFETEIKNPTCKD